MLSLSVHQPNPTSFQFFLISRNIESERNIGDGVPEWRSAARPARVSDATSARPPWPSDDPINLRGINWVKLTEDRGISRNRETFILVTKN